MICTWKTSNLWLRCGKSPDSWQLQYRELWGRALPCSAIDRSNWKEWLERCKWFGEVCTCVFLSQNMWSGVWWERTHSLVPCFYFNIIITTSVSCILFLSDIFFFFSLQLYVCKYLTIWDKMRFGAWKLMF